MATLGTNVLTLADWAKRLDPSQTRIMAIIELLQQLNEILPDVLWKEGNLPTGDRTSIRTGLPTVYWRLLNQGTQPSKSTTAVVDNTCGMLDAWSEIDEELAILNGNPNELRLSESMAFLESLSQGMAQTMFYGDTSVNPERFLGLSARYSSLTGSPSSQNVINAGGTGTDNSSIWLVTWGEMQTMGIFPRGSTVGIKHDALGLQTVQDSTGIGTARLRAYQDHYIWKAGLVVKDWRYTVRICNIDISNLTTEAAAADLYKLIIRAIHHLPSRGIGKPMLYMNRTVREFLEIQGLEKAAYQLKVEEVAGTWITSIRGIPIRTCDQLLESETALT
jgi:hypothetical protein